MKLVISIFVAGLCLATAGNVLFVITPYIEPQMLVMRDIAQDIASRQHNVLVSNPCPNALHTWPVLISR